ncbi:MAG: histidine phosphatase family protein [Paracoccus sp. (in: a-proteobacteria)]|nr:histidine phosphatase family protein [Paracoccus sp. (in: a-proteobacteria)]
MAELILIRHARSEHGAALAGRRDVPARRPPRALLEAVRAEIGEVDLLVASPALRCRQSCAWLFGTDADRLEPALWEQDFGAWEGRAFADLPEEGALPRRDLARMTPPGGESFAALYARCAPVLERLGSSPARRVAVIAHAGTVRAGLSLALGQIEAGLAFSVDNLSVTRIARAGDAWAILSVNRRGRAAEW